MFWSIPCGVECMIADYYRKAIHLCAATPHAIEDHFGEARRCIGAEGRTIADEADLQFWRTSPGLGEIAFG
jgi:hypothetical protein